MTPHTPTPWEPRLRKNGLVNLYAAGTDFDVALCMKASDADFVLRAVNSHADLLAALEGLLRLAPACLVCNDSLQGCDKCAESYPQHAAARAALAKAKGEK